MKLDWHPTAVEELLELEETVQEEIIGEIEKLPDKGLEWKKVGLVDRPEIGFTGYRIKLESGDLNHRVLFKIQDETFYVLKVGRRPDFYHLENLAEARDRL